MENTADYKKKILVFTSIAMIIKYVLYLAENFVSFKFFSLDSEALPEEIFASQNWSGVSRLAVSLITFALFFFVGKALTKDKMKAIVYTATSYFGFAVAGILPDFISAVYKVLINITAPQSVAILNTVAKPVSVPLEIFFAYTAFTALEGINEKLGSKGIGSFKTTAKQARKNYIIYFILSIVITSVLSSAPAYISAFSGGDFNMTTAFSVVSQALLFLSSALPVVVLYLIGFKPQRSHPEAMAFSSVVFFANIVSNLIFVLPITTVVNYVVNTLKIDAMEIEAYQQISLMATVSGVIISVLSVLGMVASFVIAFRLFGRFFAKAVTAEPEEFVQANPEEIAE